VLAAADLPLLAILVACAGSVIGGGGSRTDLGASWGRPAGGLQPARFALLEAAWGSGAEAIFVGGGGRRLVSFPDEI
jgi:hypothetical protein